METVEKVLGLDRERYEGWNGRHFHEKLREEHGIELSYSWVSCALQTAGLLGKRKRGRVHRRERERRPMRGMLLPVDGSPRDWIPGLGWQPDLIALQDDAANEVYEAFLCEEEGTKAILSGLRSVIVESRSGAVRRRRAIAGAAPFGMTLEPIRKFVCGSQPK